MEVKQCTRTLLGAIIYCLGNKDCIIQRILNTEWNNTANKQDMQLDRWIQTPKLINHISIDMSYISVAILAFNIDRKTTNDIQAKGDIPIGQFLFTFFFLVAGFNVIKLF